MNLCCRVLFCHRTNYLKNRLNFMTSGNTTRGVVSFIRHNAFLRLQVIGPGCTRGASRFRNFTLIPYLGFESNGVKTVANDSIAVSVDLERFLVYHQGAITLVLPNLNLARICFSKFFTYPDETKCFKTNWN